METRRPQFIAPAPLRYAHVSLFEAPLDTGWVGEGTTVDGAAFEFDLVRDYGNGREDLTIARIRDIDGTLVSDIDAALAGELAEAMDAWLKFFYRGLTGRMAIMGADGAYDSYGKRAA